MGSRVLHSRLLPLEGVVMIQVRGKIYRGVDGFTVCGRPKDSGWSLAIFVKHLSTARAIQALYKRDDLSPQERGRLVDKLILEER